MCYNIYHTIYCICYTTEGEPDDDVGRRPGAARGDKSHHNTKSLSLSIYIYTYIIYHTETPL